MSIITRPAHEREVPKVENLGEDGQYLVAHAHVDGRLFVCLAFTELASLMGTDVVDYFEVADLNNWARDVEHLWAIEIPAESPGDEDRLQWGGVTEQTEGAFRITKLDLE